MESIVGMLCANTGEYESGGEMHSYRSMSLRTPGLDIRLDGDIAAQIDELIEREMEKHLSSWQRSVDTLRAQQLERQFQV